MKGKKEKKLKVWNGGGLYRGEYNRWSVNVAAYSQKQAVEMIEKAFSIHMGLSFFRDHYSDCWGDDMDGIEPTEPTLYVTKRGEQRVKLI